MDAKDLHVILNMPDDPDGYPWYHCLLVLQINGGRWVSLGSELELSVVDLDFADYILLDRNALFPQDKYADIFYFELMSQSEVGVYRK